MRLPILFALVAAAAAAAGDDPLAPVVEPRRTPPPPRPPADPEEVARLASEGTEAEIRHYRREHLLSPTQDGDLLQRLDDLDMMRSIARLERLEIIAQEQGAKEARLRAERQAERAAAPMTPLSVRCPVKHCRAKPGKRCRGRGGELLDTCHPERVRVFERVGKP